MRHAAPIRTFVFLSFQFFRHRRRHSVLSATAWLSRCRSRSSPTGRMAYARILTTMHGRERATSMARRSLEASHSLLFSLTLLRSLACAFSIFFFSWPSKKKNVFPRGTFFGTRSISPLVPLFFLPLSLYVIYLHTRFAALLRFISHRCCRERRRVDATKSSSEVITRRSWRRFGLGVREIRTHGRDRGRANGEIAPTKTRVYGNSA